jgi:hypothetical protein
MSNRTVDLLFHRLANAPRGVDCSNREVISAAGILISSIMRVAFDDPAKEAAMFCAALQACVDPAFKAKLMQQQSRHSTLN